MMPSIHLALRLSWGTPIYLCGVLAGRWMERSKPTCIINGFDARVSFRNPGMGPFSSFGTLARTASIRCYDTILVGNGGTGRPLPLALSVVRRLGAKIDAHALAGRPLPAATRRCPPGERSHGEQRQRNDRIGYNKTRNRPSRTVEADASQSMRAL